MRTPEFDPNKEFVRREAACKRGKLLEAYLPVKRPPFYKKRVAELYARYNFFPVNVRIQTGFPELGLCIVFIPFRCCLLGQYEHLTSRETKDYLAKLINKKSPKRRS